MDCNVDAQQMIILFSPRTLLHLSQPSVQLKSYPRLRNPTWPVVWLVGEKKWSSLVPTSSQSPRSSSWRKAPVSVMYTPQLSTEAVLQKQLVPIMSAEMCVSWLADRLCIRGTTMTKTFNASVGQLFPLVAENVRTLSSCKCAQPDKTRSGPCWHGS